MSASVDVVFIEQFEREVHHAFQREGSKLRGLTREITNAQGYKVHFPKLGTISATTKARHQRVPIADAVHTRPAATIEDYYAAEMVDSLDQLKTNVMERQELARAITYSLGRQMDQVIVDDGIDQSSNTTTTVGKITLAKCQEVFTYLGNQDVPDDGNRFFAASPKGWADLMELTQFSDADYVPESELVFKGSANTAKRWFTFYVFTFSGLSKTGNTRSSAVWHKRAIGSARQQDPKVQIDWENLEQAWSIVGAIAIGATVIDSNGLYLVKHDETA